MKFKSIMMTPLIITPIAFVISCGPAEKNAQAKEKDTSVNMGDSFVLSYTIGGYTKTYRMHISFTDILTLKKVWTSGMDYLGGFTYLLKNKFMDNYIANNVIVPSDYYTIDVFDAEKI